MESSQMCTHTCTEVIWGERSSRACYTCGFCRNVCLWLAQPPQRFRSGSAFLAQLPKCTYSCQVLWTLINEVFMTRHTSASVKNLHQSVNDILKIWTESFIKIWKSGINCPEIVLWLRKFITYQNSPSSSTVMPRLCLSVSPTFAHSSELANNNKARQNV